MSIFTEDNIEALKLVCQQIAGICGEHVNGNLMYSQKMALGLLIDKLIKNEIIQKSGILKN